MGEADKIGQRIAECRGKGGKSLNLAGLDLEEIPPAVRNLRQLRNLDLGGNLIEALPAWIGELDSLVELYVIGNPLRTIPDSITRLKRLRSLIVTAGSKVIVPDMGGLTHLRRLALIRVGLPEVPPWIRRLRQLQLLWLDWNPLRNLPEWIGELSQLTTLHVSNARLRSLPIELRGLEKLEDLRLNGNTQLGLPAEILNEEVPQILEYYFRIRDPTARQRLNEFKLVVVGRGSVGKTTLVHRLVMNRFKRFRRTPGIQITKWPIEINGERVHAHIWDFGGQEILHGTHRFFMTERALYLILLSGREGTEDADAEYWLSLVRSFAGDVPVIVLLHKWDDYPFELNRALLVQKYGQIRFLSTDSETNHGIDALRKEISQQAVALPGLKAAWPVAWQRIKDELPRKRKSWLTFDEFCAFCRQRGVDPVSEHEALAGYLHDLGLMLSYRRDSSLRSFGVLHPQWVTKAIYQILNSGTIRNAGGVFELKSLGKELSAKEYPEALHGFLLALMIRFKLCHPLDTRGSKYLIPELLSKQEPPLDIDFPPADCLNFVYQYDVVLPEGLLPRFIVDSYVHQKTAWRTGAVLERSNCRAMIRGDLQARTVTIRVAGTGNGRRELLGIIREHFDRIHESYERLPITAKVPVPRHPDVHIDYGLLLAHERAHESTIAVSVGGRIQRFNVVELLDGSDLPGASRISSTSHKTHMWGEPITIEFMEIENIFKKEYSHPISEAKVISFKGFRPKKLLSSSVGLPLDAFVAYSRTDIVFLDQLRAALVPHERVGELRLWYDALTEPGQKWESVILDRLERARIVILLLSNDFLQSSFCMDKELPRALERSARGACDVIPVLVRACRYDKLALGDIQTIRPGGKSIDEHEKKDPAWELVTREIDRVIERIKKKSSEAR